MSIKSILRAVGGFLSGRMGDAAANRMEALAGDLERDRIGRRAVARLKGRRDWETRWGMRPADPLPIDPAPVVAPWDQAEFDARAEALKSKLWPAHDDPYAKPKPCDVVQDPGLSTIRDYAACTNENSRRLAERGLAGRPMDSIKSVMDLLNLIERQEAAERELIHRGMEWDPVTRRWIDPDTQP